MIKTTSFYVNIILDFAAAWLYGSLTKKFKPIGPGWVLGETNCQHKHVSRSVSGGMWNALSHLKDKSALLKVVGRVWCVWWHPSFLKAIAIVWFPSQKDALSWTLVSECSAKAVPFDPLFNRVLLPIISKTHGINIVSDNRIVPSSFLCSAMLCSTQNSVSWRLLIPSRGLIIHFH